MTFDNIVSRVNKKLAGEFTTYSELIHLLDETIDDINESLNSTYPAFSELDQGETEYIHFPDSYIRKVVIIGAAHKFYVEDEEGETTANDYGVSYIENLAAMTRDYIHLVPEEYQKTGTGYITDSRMDSENVGGIVLYDEDYGL